MMHNDYTLLMSLVLDHEATTQEEAELRMHLRTCDECSLTWQRWQELDRRFEVAPLIQAPVGLEERVVARVEQAQVIGVRRRKFATWFSLALAGALVLTGMLALLISNWPLQLPPAVSAALSGLVDAGEWVLALAIGMVAALGAPAVAATAGALLCFTCCLAMAWLWIVNHTAARGQRGAVTA